MDRTIVDMFDIILFVLIWHLLGVFFSAVDDDSSGECGP